MTVTGACLSLSLSVLYGRMLHYPCLQCFIVDPPERPVNRMFLIPGNNTGTGILQNIIDNDGRGLIFESEADEMMISRNTAASWLQRWRRAGAVKQRDKRGVYIYIITRPRSRL